MKHAKAFAAGVLSTLVFHQATLALLHALSLTERAAYDTTPAWPLHIPAFVSLAFWGGVWALALAVPIDRLRSAAARGMAWILFGALLPSLVAWFVVMPLKGASLAAGVPLIALVLNGAWGLGVAVIRRLLRLWAC
jgi:hypothetical protein